VDVLSSPILLRPGDLDRSRRFYRDVLGLAICREFGPPDDPGVAFFLGPGFLEISGCAAGPAGRPEMIWIQVRDVRAEMWIGGPDGIRIVLVEVPAGHPLRRTRDRRQRHDDEPLTGADGPEPLAAGRRSFQHRPP
jgi:catechol 2,3-dioxygenase-like lactoylglutathione lyase family enzyme